MLSKAQWLNEEKIEVGAKLQNVFYRSQPWMVLCQNDAIDPFYNGRKSNPKHWWSFEINFMLDPWMAFVIQEKWNKCNKMSYIVIKSIFL